MNKLLLVIFCFLFVSCPSVEPKNVKIEDRLRPPYNYVLMQKMQDNKGDYNWNGNYKDGYYRTGYKFHNAYKDVMKETNDMSQENAYKIYKEQKSKIARRYKNETGDRIQVQKEEEAIAEFDPKTLKENEEIIVTNDNDFAVTKDIVINVDATKEQQEKDVENGSGV